MEEAGVKLIAQGASAYDADMKSATNATNAFVDQTEKGAGIVGRAGNAMGSAIKGVAAIAAGVGVAGFLALGKAIFDGLGDARESARLNAATEQTILTMGNAAGVSAIHVADMAAALSDASGKSLFGDDQIQQASNLLLTFGNIKGETFDLATALTVDLAQALGGAPADQAMMLGKALQDPVKGITALGKAGLTFSEEQKTMIAAMVDSGDVAGAQSLIIAELNKQVGGQAAAAATAAGGIEQFKARLGETAETVGAALLPMLNAFGDWLNSPEVTQGIGDFADALVVAFEWAADNIPPTITQIVDGIQDLVGWFDKGGAQAASLGSAVDDLSVIWAKAQDVITNVMNAYVGIAQSVLPIITKFVDDHGTEISAFFKTTYDTIIRIVNLALDLYNAVVPKVLGQVANWIDEHATGIQAVLSGAWDVITGVITGALALIEGVIKTSLALMQGDWEGAWAAIQAMSVTFVESLGKTIEGFLNIIAGFFNTNLDEIVTLWENNWAMLVDIATETDWAAVGQSVVDGILQGLRDAWSRLSSWVSEKVGSLVDDAMAAIGASSPAKDFMPVGQFSVQGIMAGFEYMWPSLTAQVAKLAEGLVDQVKDIAESVQSEIADAFGATASIDRQIAKNMEALSTIDDDFYRNATENAMRAAQAQAEMYADPEAGAKFFKLKSAQILEFQKLQQEINEEEDAATKRRLEQQQILILKAQEAEMSAFEATNNRADSPLTDIRAQIDDIMEAARAIDPADLAGKGATKDAIAAMAALQGSVIDMLAGVLGQAYASPPMQAGQYAGGGATTTSNQRTYNMPIYTNNTPAALQQSLAIAEAMAL